MARFVSFVGLSQHQRRKTGLLVLCIAGLGTLTPTQLSGVNAADDKVVEAQHGMVVSVSPPGTDVGVEVLKKGGNAVDAAVATAFALAVTYPAAGNIGGGGFMVVYPGGKAEPVVIEYRETPAGMFYIDPAYAKGQRAALHDLGRPGRDGDLEIPDR